MLGLAHTLVAEGLHDRAFLDRYTVGFERFEAYLLGRSDGQPKDADWAAAITGIDAESDPRARARAWRRARTMVTVTWSLQRADHGEQPYWMAIALAAMLGQIGLPGGGFGFGYGRRATASATRSARSPGRRCRRAATRSTSFIPVARISRHAARTRASRSTTTASG